MSEKHQQVAAQCRLVAHLATGIAQLHSTTAELMAANAVPDIVDIVGNETARFMETLGDMLNGMDGVSGEDDWTGPVFEEAQRLFPQPQTVEIPGARHEALMVAAKAAYRAHGFIGPLTEGHEEFVLLDKAIAALRAAVIETEG